MPGCGSPRFRATMVRCRASTQTGPTSCLLLRPGLPSKSLRSQFPLTVHPHILTISHTSLSSVRTYTTSLIFSLKSVATAYQQSKQLILHTYHHSSCCCIFSQNGYPFSINSSQVPHGSFLLPYRWRSHASHPITSVTHYNNGGAIQPEVITFHPGAHNPDRGPTGIPEVRLRRKPLSTPRSVERQVKALSAELSQVQHRSLYCLSQEGARAWSI